MGKKKERNQGLLDDATDLCETQENQYAQATAARKEELRVLAELRGIVRRDMLNSPRVLPTELMLMNSRLMRTNPNTKEKTTLRKVMNSMPVVLLAPNSREMKNSKDSCEYEEKRKQDPH